MSARENAELTRVNPWFAGRALRQGGKPGEKQAYTAAGSSNSVEGRGRAAFVQVKGSCLRRHAPEAGKARETAFADVVDGTDHYLQERVVVAIERIAGVRQGIPWGAVKPFSPSIIRVLKSLIDDSAVLCSNRGIIDDLLVGGVPAAPIGWRRIVESCSFEGLAKAVRSPDYDFETWLPVRQPAQIAAEPRGGSRQGTVPADREPGWCADVSRSLLDEDHLEPGAAESKAKNALADAGVLARREKLPPPTSTNVSEEGVVSLKWGSGRNGLLVVLSGGGEASFSVKADAEFFDIIHDFDVQHGLPHAARTALGNLSVL